MDLNGLLQCVRDHYVEQFRVFVAAMQDELGGGVAELKLQIKEGEGLFRGLYCIDFCANIDGQASFREMQPDLVLNFDRFMGTVGQADLEVVSLRWHDINVEHDLEASPGGLDGWFDTWFDPEGTRYDPAAEFSLCIHSVSTEPGKLNVDFGTAPPDAFWHLVKVLLDAGARRIRISGSEDIVPEIVN